MKKRGIITWLFVLGGLYDGILGLAFMFASDRVFDLYEVTPPNHLGYVHFPAALLVVFAIMFFAIAAKPQENRNLIPYGMLLKVSYCGVVLYHWTGAGIPDMWKPFFFVDLAFLAAFAWAWMVLGKKIA